MGGKDEEGYKDENGRSLRDEKDERKEGETEEGRLNRQKYKITHISGVEYGAPPPALPALGVLLSLSGATVNVPTPHSNPKHLSGHAPETRPGLPASSDPQPLHRPSGSCQGHHDLRPQRRVFVLVLEEGTGRQSALQRGRGPRACHGPSGADLFCSPAGSRSNLSRPRCTRPLSLWRRLGDSERDRCWDWQPR